MQDGRMKFLCDEMLRGLGRWLRAAGYDTAIAGNGTADRDLLHQAVAEGRLLISRDRRLLDHRAIADRVVLLGAEGIEGWARELSARLPIDWLYQPFSRCLLCNGPLVPIDDAGRATLPPTAAKMPGPFRCCRHCEKIYWEGSHVRRMRAHLAHFSEFSKNPRNSKRPINSGTTRSPHADHPTARTRKSPEPVSGSGKSGRSES